MHLRQTYAKVICYVKTTNIRGLSLPEIYTANPIAGLSALANRFWFSGRVQVEPVCGSVAGLFKRS